ncbi:hypothetical protein O0235_06905 [Tepidiforma flava]|uniref:Uncharacterized protein n=1 Tax=Tepidiforma flava TaxID=3004094 RepID=A0ABY7MBC1_9CHLR|nr:hypothetical protein [Tepidiforma flava]WBL37294.1 hypothetical protein O0235_06905 [Tepidiforma flava]
MMTHESGGTRRLETVDVPVLRAGEQVWTVRLQGEPDPDYGHLFAPEEADRWAARRRALLRLRQFERPAGPPAPGAQRPAIATWTVATARGASTFVTVETYHSGPVGGGAPASAQMRLPLGAPR